MKEKVKSFEPEEAPTWKEIRDAYLAKKQGEALERITIPRKHYEGLGLGYFGPQTVLALAAVDLVEEVINALAINPTITIREFDEEGNITKEYEEDVPLIPAFKETINSLHIFTETIGVASGSRAATRMEKALETIGSLGQYEPPEKSQMPEPQAVDLNE